MVKVEFTGSVEEVSKEILDFLRMNYISLSENVGAPKSDTEKAIDKLVDEAVGKKAPTKKVEEAPTTKLPTAAVKEETAVEVPTPLPTKTAEYTAADLQKIAADWISKDNKNHRNTMKELLAKFGVQAITTLPKENYGAFVQELKNLGADV